MKRSLSVLAAAALLIGAMPQPVESDAGLRAAVGLRPIPLRAVGRYHCHDLDRPIIRCFRDPASRDRQVMRLATGVGTTPRPDTMLLDYYVTFYEHASYGGASYTTSGGLTNLADIGWNDVVSSFKSLNGLRPRWWEDAGYAGTAFMWSAGAQVSYVGDSANDRFSSVKKYP